MNRQSSVRAVIHRAEGYVLASAEIAAPIERVFQALASEEVVRWWVRPGVFDTRSWEGDLRVGGRWRITGLFRGEAYAIEGEYLELDPPQRLVHTWHPVGSPPAATSTVSYLLEPIAGGTRLTLKHSGFGAPEIATSNGLGWETSLEALEALFQPESGSAPT